MVVGGHELCNRRPGDNPALSKLFYVEMLNEVMGGKLSKRDNDDGSAFCRLNKLSDEMF